MNIPHPSTLSICINVVFLTYAWRQKGMNGGGGLQLSQKVDASCYYLYLFIYALDYFTTLNLQATKGVLWCDWSTFHQKHEFKTH